MIVAGLADLLICFKRYFTGGSNPPTKEEHMALRHKARLGVGRVLGGIHHVMFCWVVRAPLLALGVWGAYPRPHAHSSIIRAGT